MVSDTKVIPTVESDRYIESRWVRTGGVLGILSVALLMAGSLVFGVPNLTSSSSSTAISSYLSSHGSSVLMLTLVTVLGTSIGLWFLATLARMIHEHDRKSPLGMIVLASGVVATSMSTFDGVTLSGLVYLHRQGGPSDPALVRIFFDLQNGLIMPGLFGFFMAGFLAAVGLAMVRGHLARPWLGWLAFVLAALASVGAAVGLLSVSGGTSLIGYSPVIGYGIFAIITSVFLLRDRRSPAIF